AQWRVIARLGLVNQSWSVTPWAAASPICTPRHTPSACTAWWDDLPKIAVPLLLIGGGTSSHIPQNKLVEVVARVRDGQLVTIDGAGHQVHRTHPTEFLAAIRTFLAAP